MGIFNPAKGFRQLKGNARELISYRNIISLSYLVFSDIWVIRLYFVPLEISRRQKVFIQETGLQLMKNWLNQEKPQTWFEGHRYFQIGINEDLTKYCIFETQNNHIIDKQIKLIT